MSGSGGMEQDGDMGDMVHVKIVCWCRDWWGKYQKIDSILSKITPVSLSIRGIIYTQK